MLLAIVVVAVTAALAILGQDANWDLLNYHVYSPAAWLDGRIDVDIGPAQRQSWHNPLADLPLWPMLRANAGGVLVTAWLAVPALIALLCTLLLLDAWLPGPASTARSIAALLLALGGAAATATLGTTFNDWLVAAGVMLALWWVVAGDDRGVLRTWLPAGLVLGAVTGLKLTGIAYCVALAAATIVAGPLRTCTGRLAALAAGGVIGAALTYGFWGWELWTRFGNPVFPYFNHVFLAPDAPAIAFSDIRFRPKSVIDGLLAPIHLLSASTRFSEIILRDPRLLLGLVALATLPLCGWRRPGQASPGINPYASRFLAVFFVAGLAMWLALYGIYRYAVPLELLAVVFVVGAISIRMTGPPLVAALIAVVSIVHAATIHPDWGRQPFSSPMVEVRWPALPPASLVVVCTSEPVAFALAYAPPSLPAVGLCNNLTTPGDCSGLQVRGAQTIATNPGPLWLLRGPSDDRERDLTAAGLEVTGACRPLPNSLTGLALCPLRRSGTPTDSCSARAASRDVTTRGEPTVQTGRPDLQ